MVEQAKVEFTQLLTTMQNFSFYKKREHVGRWVYKSGISLEAKVLFFKKYDELVNPKAYEWYLKYAPNLEDFSFKNLKPELLGSLSKNPYLTKKFILDYLIHSRSTSFNKTWRKATKNFVVNSNALNILGSKTVALYLKQAKEYQEESEHSESTQLYTRNYKPNFLTNHPALYDMFREFLQNQFKEATGDKDDNVLPDEYLLRVFLT